MQVQQNGNNLHSSTSKKSENERQVTQGTALNPKPRVVDTSERDDQSQEHRSERSVSGAPMPGPEGGIKMPPAATTPGREEFTGLLGRYITGGGNVPGDVDNAHKLMEWQREVLGGAPQNVMAFEARQQEIGAKVANFAPAQRFAYGAQQASYMTAYHAASTAEQRQDIEQQFMPFSAAVDGAYRDYLHDPARQVQAEFEVPYGSRFLDAKEQAQAGDLEKYRSAFNMATTAEARDDAFSKAVQLRNHFQEQIGNTIQKNIDGEKAAREASRSVIENALKRADTEAAHHVNEPANNDYAFMYLKNFGNEVFTSERNALTFKEMQQKEPDKFTHLRQWDAEVSKKTQQAREKINTDPFARSANVPDVPGSYLNVDDSKAPVANYSQEMLAQYQDTERQIQNAQTLYHAFQQGGPIKQDYLAANRPPKPEWQQVADEALCRLTGDIFTGGVLNDAVCPKSPMSEEGRKVLDAIGAVVPLGGPLEAGVGEMLGKGVDAVAKAAGKVSGVTSKAFEKLGTKEAEQALEDTYHALFERKPGDVPNKGADSPAVEPAGGASSGFQIPASYASEPHGALTPFPRAKGIFSDATGQMFIKNGDHAYRVGFDRDNDTWRVQGQDGTKYRYPVRIDASGNWETHGDVGLKGGADHEGAGTAEAGTSGVLANPNKFLKPADVPAGMRLNNEGMLERSDIKKLYRADSPDSRDSIERDGFFPSQDFSGVDKMINRHAIIASETIEGARKFGDGRYGQGHYDIYEINADGATVASLQDNVRYNTEFMSKKLGWATPDDLLKAQPKDVAEGALEFREVHADESVGQPGKFTLLERGIPPFKRDHSESGSGSGSGNDSDR